MKKGLAFDSTTLSLYYSRNRMFIVPGVVIIVCVILLLEVVTPQLMSWYATQQLIAQNKQSIDTLSHSIDVLSGFDDATLDTNLTLVTTALPGDKELLGTLGSINRAAIASKVALSDYSFQGDKTSKGLSIDLVVTGSLAGVQQFLTSIKNELPLATVDGVDYVAAGGSTIHVSFYYTTFPHFTFNAQTPLSDLNAKQNDLLAQLSSFDSAIGSPVTIPVSSSEAVLTTPTPSPSVSPKPSISVVPLATGSAAASKSANK